MKKRLVYILCAALALMNLTGCAGKTTETMPAKEQAEAVNGDVLTIEFFQQKGEEGPQKGYQAIIDQFNKENPDIKIEMNTVPDAPTVLTSRISSGDIPVIFTDFPTQLQFKQKVKNGFVEKLSGQEFLKQVEPESLKMGKAEDGEDYALPYSHNYMGVYYNQEIFDKYNLKVPETWDEFVAVCETLKSNGEVPMGLFGKDPGRVGHTFQCSTIAWIPDGVETIAKAAKGEVKIADSQGFKAAADKMVTLLSYSNEDALAMSDTACWEAFANGKFAMCITGSYARGTIMIANPNLKLGVFPLPNDTKETTNTLSGIDAAVCISAKASEEEKKAALKFLDFLAKTENAQIFCDNDGAPSCIKGVEHKDKGIKPMLDLIGAGQVHDWMASTIENNVVMDLYNVTQGFWGDKDVSKYLDEMDKSIEITSAQ